MARQRLGVSGISFVRFPAVVAVRVRSQSLLLLKYVSSIRLVGIVSADFLNIAICSKLEAFIAGRVSVGIQRYHQSLLYPTTNRTDLGEWAQRTLPHKGDKMAQCDFMPHVNCHPGVGFGRRVASVDELGIPSEGQARLKQQPASIRRVAGTLLNLSGHQDALENDELL